MSLWLIHVDVWQKPTEYCKAQLKINKIILKREPRKTKTTKKTQPTHQFYLFFGHSAQYMGS